MCHHIIVVIVGVKYTSIPQLVHRCHLDLQTRKIEIRHQVAFGRKNLLCHPPKLLSSTFNPSPSHSISFSLPMPPLLPPPVRGARCRPGARGSRGSRRPWSSRTPRSPPPPRVRNLRGTPPLARRSLCSTLAAAHAEGRSSRRVEEDERRDGGLREAPPPEPVRRRDGGSRALEQSRAEQPGPRRAGPPRPALGRAAPPPRAGRPRRCPPAVGGGRAGAGGAAARPAASSPLPLHLRSPAPRPPSLRHGRERGRRGGRERGEGERRGEAHLSVREK